MNSALLLKCAMNFSFTSSVSSHTAASLDERWSSRSPLLCNWAPRTLGSGAGLSVLSDSVTFSNAKFAFSVGLCGVILDKPSDLFPYDEYLFGSLLVSRYRGRMNCWCGWDIVGGVDVRAVDVGVFCWFERVRFTELEERCWKFFHRLIKCDFYLLGCCPYCTSC